MQKLLYHYCSLNTFLSIIGNKTIRASDCSKTNDTEETRWIATMIESVFLEKINESNKFCLKYNITEEKLNYIKNQITKVINAVFYQNSRHMTTYTTCFSEKGDLLSQWRGYADDAKGISIGFDKKILQSFDTGGYNFHFKKVIYKSQEQTMFIKNYLGELIESYELVNDERLTPLDKLFNDFLYDLSLRVLTIRNDSPQFKNSAFQEEREWRLFVNNHLSNLYCYDHKNDEVCAGYVDENYNKECIYSNGFIRHPTKFRSSDNRIISYFDLNFAKIKDNLIKEIIIGPKCETSMFDIQLFLAANDYSYDEIKIRKSKATYR